MPENVWCKICRNLRPSEKVQSKYLDFRANLKAAVEISSGGRVAVASLGKQLAEVFWSLEFSFRTSTWEETPGRAPNLLEGLCIPTGLGTLQAPPGGAGKPCWGEERLEHPA